jgi:hypothetical protein
MLRGLHLAIIEAAALLVPAPQRAEWLAEWRAELWYVNRRATAFCLGSFSDALWMNRNTPAPIARRWFGLESPVRCLMFLAGLTGLSVLLAIGPLSHGALAPPRSAVAQDMAAVSAPEDSDRRNPTGPEPSPSPQNHAANPLPIVAPGQTGQGWAPNWRDGYLGLPLALCLLLLVMFSSVTPLSLGEYPVNRCAPAAPLRLLRWVFLAVKVALVIPAVLCGALALGPIAPPLAAWGLFFGLLFAFRWALMDQRERCPVCLRLLSNPTRIGDASQCFLGWYGTELVCSHGHGFLYVPGTSTSWYDTQRWQYLDPTWSNLLP